MKGDEVTCYLPLVSAKSKIANPKSKFYSMEQITGKGIILMVLMSDLLIIIGVTVVLLISRSLSGRQPDKSERIVRAACITSTTIAIIFGVLAETIIVLTILWTVNFI